MGTERTMSILVIDDEPRLRQAIARSLSGRGYLVDQAASCREAVEAATAKHYDLLLVDVNLPDATGWDVLRELSAAGVSIPAVVVSAVPPSATRVREFQPFGVLHKPFPMDALLRLVGMASEIDQPERGKLPLPASEAV